MKWDKPKEGVTALDMVFGPLNLNEYLPSMAEIPEEFQPWNNPWQELVSKWFFSGLKESPKPKEGINSTAALAHIRVILGSFEPKHEHKTAGCAYLMSLWFELPAKPEGR